MSSKEKKANPNKAFNKSINRSINSTKSINRSIIKKSPNKNIIHNSSISKNSFQSNQRSSKTPEKKKAVKTSNPMDHYKSAINNISQMKDQFENSKQINNISQNCSIDYLNDSFGTGTGFNNNNVFSNTGTSNQQQLNDLNSDYSYSDHNNSQEFNASFNRSIRSSKGYNKSPKRGSNKSPKGGNNTNLINNITSTISSSLPIDERLELLCEILGLSDIIKIFRDNKISFNDLFYLTKEDLLELEIPISPRNRILKFTEMYKSFGDKLTISEIRDFFKRNKTLVVNKKYYDNFISQHRVDRIDRGEKEIKIESPIREGNYREHEKYRNYTENEEKKIKIFTDLNSSPSFNNNHKNHSNSTSHKRMNSNHSNHSYNSNNSCNSNSNSKEKNKKYRSKDYIADSFNASNYKDTSLCNLTNSTNLKTFNVNNIDNNLYENYNNDNNDNYESNDNCVNESDNYYSQTQPQQIPGLIQNSSNSNFNSSINTKDTYNKCQTSINKINDRSRSNTPTKVNNIHYNDKSPNRNLSNLTPERKKPNHKTNTNTNSNYTNHTTNNNTPTMSPLKSIKSRLVPIRGRKNFKNFTKDYQVINTEVEDFLKKFKEIKGKDNDRKVRLRHFIRSNTKSRSKTRSKSRDRTTDPNYYSIGINNLKKTIQTLNKNPYKDTKSNSKNRTITTNELKSDKSSNRSNISTNITNTKTVRGESPEQEKDLNEELNRSANPGYINMNNNSMTNSNNKSGISNKNINNPNNSILSQSTKSKMLNNSNIDHNSNLNLNNSRLSYSNTNMTLNDNTNVSRKNNISIIKKNNNSRIHSRDNSRDGRNNSRDNSRDNSLIRNKYNDISNTSSLNETVPDKELDKLNEILEKKKRLMAELEKTSNSISEKKSLLNVVNDNSVEEDDLNKVENILNISELNQSRNITMFSNSSKSNMSTSNSNTNRKIYVKKKIS